MSQQEVYELVNPLTQTVLHKFGMEAAKPVVPTPDTVSTVFSPENMEEITIYQGHITHHKLALSYYCHQTWHCICF